MTAEKKSKAKANDRQRIARDRAVQDTPTIEPGTEKPPEATAWHERAAFHVTLDHHGDADGATFWQTHAYHEETGDECVQLGVLDQDVIGWMRNRAGLPAESVPIPEPTPAAEPPAEAPQAAMGLSVGGLEVIELPAERQIGGEEISVRLCAEVSFDLTGAMAYLATADQAPYVIQVLALDLEGTQSTLLASDRRELQPEHVSYAETLDLSVPAIGSYQLIANVVLPDHDAAAAAIGPMLNVVP